MTTVAVASPLAAPEQIQGNILLPFRDSHQAFLFLSFHHDRRGARRWLAEVATRVSGTDDVGEVRQDSAGVPEKCLVNVGLTAPGLVLLRTEVAADLASHDAFWRGPLGARLDDAHRLTTAPALLGDVDASDPRNWLIGGPSGPAVDALLTLAAEDRQTLAAAVEREIQAASDAGLEVLPLGEAPDAPRVQWGEVLRKDGKRIEHFGFRDGISQPGVRGFRTRPGEPAIAPGEFILGCPGERRPQSWAPRPSAAPWMRGGSFQVFRRLRQDPAGWWARMARLSEAERLAGPAAAAERALGRRLDGRPLAPLQDPEQLNDFTYGDDESGVNTPLYAHIRKMNPREDDVFRGRNHKMLRRGIPFGPMFDPEKPDTEERGLIFNAYMACIEDQFEFLQRRWANDPEFPASTLARYGRDIGGSQRFDGFDPILGADAEGAARRLPKEVVERIPPAAFGGFVQTTGAVYAFAPTLPALRALAGAEPL